MLSASILVNGLASWSIPRVIAPDHKYIIITADATIHWVEVDESTETSRTQSWGRYITSPRRLITVMEKWRWFGLLDKQPLWALQTVRHCWTKLRYIGFALHWFGTRLGFCVCFPLLLLLLFSLPQLLVSHVVKKHLTSPLHIYFWPFTELPKMVSFAQKPFLIKVLETLSQEVPLLCSFTYVQLLLAHWTYSWTTRALLNCHVANGNHFSLIWQLHLCKGFHSDRTVLHRSIS